MWFSVTDKVVDGGVSPTMGSNRVRLFIPQATKKPARWRVDCWLGREDSNLRMPVPKTGALDHLATPHCRDLPLPGWRAMYSDLPGSATS